MAESVLAQRIQDAFVLLAITDDKFLKICRRSVLPRYFSSEITESIVHICYAYYDQFGEAPVNHFHDELVRLLANKDEDVKTRYIEYLQRIQEMDPPSDAYVLTRINQFIKGSELKDAAVRFARAVAEGEFDKAQSLMLKALKSGVQQEEVGIDYFKQEIPTYYDTETDCEHLMPTGWSVLDQYLPRGLCRTDFVCVLGGGKGKKSWSMVHLGKVALMNGMKVLHITHELSAGDTEMRYDRALGCLTKERTPITVPFDVRDQNGVLVHNESRTIPSVYNPEEIKKVRKVVERMGGKLIIKKYVINTCTVSELERYLDYLETFEGFTPDVVVNDYPEKMKLAVGEFRRDSIHDIYINTKRIAEERKQLWLTVSQVPRSALKKAVLDKDDFAEDIRKLEDVDLVIAISHNRAQAQGNQMQAFILANRHGADTFGCHFNLQLDAGQMVTNCWPMRFEREEETEKEHDE